MTYNSDVDEALIPPHGGYQNLAAYQMAEIVHDGTVVFARQYVSKFSRTVDQMVQAARSGKQNIAEGSMASGTSKKTELKLMGVARASLEELLVDYKDFLRQNGYEQWPKDHEKALYIRQLARKEGTEDRSYKSYGTYKTYIETKGAENAANTMLCLIHQTNFLLDQLLRQLGEAFKENGGFSERIYRVRSKSSGRN